MGRKINRTQIELTDEEVERTVRTFHAWRGQSETGDYADEAGFCRSASLEEMEGAGFTLSPGRYVGAPDSEEDEIAFEERMAGLLDRLADEMAENERLGAEVTAALARAGYEV